jgi:hypothetical protein
VLADEVGDLTLANAAQLLRLARLATDLVHRLAMRDAPCPRAWRVQAVAPWA